MPICDFLRAGAETFTRRMVLYFIAAPQSDARTDLGIP